jgi:hypothetical protein
MKKELVGNVKNSIPALVEDNELDTYSDPNFKNYTNEEDFLKNTGIVKKDMPAFCVKEGLDNACDFVEKYHKLNPTLVAIRLATDSESNIHLSVINPNKKDTQVFKDLKKTFTYNRSFTSKGGQYKVTKGYQGDALSGTMPYIMQEKKQDWEHPITFKHNGKTEEVYIHVDHKGRRIIPTVERGLSVDNTNTSVSMVLPPVSQSELSRLHKFIIQYTLFNTYTAFKIYFDESDEPDFTIPALHSIPNVYQNPNSVYCYDEQELTDLLNDIPQKDMSVYEALRKSEFRELNQRDGRFDYLKQITVGEITEAQIKKLYKKLRTSMLAMSKLSVPYSVKVLKRKNALLDRYRQMKPSNLEIDIERAVYVRTPSNKDAVHTEWKGNDVIKRFPYIFEVLAIPIKPQCGFDENIIISGVNYSTSITNEQYFEGHYTTEYQWEHKRTHEDLVATDIDEIIRMSMAGKQVNDIANIPPNKQRAPCVLIAHLVAPRIQYRSYGKSSLELGPFSTSIAETIQTAILRLPEKSKYTGLTKSEVKDKDTVMGCLRKLLSIRWNMVRANPSILHPSNDFYDPWSQSTVFYHLRDEYLLPLEVKYKVQIIKEGTRDQIQNAISEECEKLPGNPKREDLGIFASPRATMYFRGRWYNVDIKDIPALAGRGTDVIFIEKRGVVQQIQHISDTYGVAFVNTPGHFAEYPRDLVPAIVEKGGYVIILTDFDCAGIHIAERVISELEGLHVNVESNRFGKGGTEQIAVTDRVRRLGIDIDSLEYFVNSGIKDKQGNPIINIEAFQEMVEESYPRSSKDKEQQPGFNVASPIIEYARKYYLFDTYSDKKFEEYERYGYIYDNFEYLTGLDVESDFIKGNKLTHFSIGEEEPLSKREMKDSITVAMKDRTQGAAKRIELDSVIKVVRANMFAQFVLDKMQEYFPERDGTRAMELPKEYFAEKFHILPEPVKKFFLYCADKSDETSNPVDEQIQSDLKQTKGLLEINSEDALSERLRSEAVGADADMGLIAAKCEELMRPGVLPEVKSKSEPPSSESD